MIAKDGFKIIFYTGILVLIFFVLAFSYQSIWFWSFFLVFSILFVFHFFFFRDPERKIPDIKGQILSPADGQILKIDQIEEPIYIKGPAQRIAIFMSVFNAHINRNPVTGSIEYLQHKSGQFLAAYADKAPDANECTDVGVNTPYGKVFFKQIAGLIARRIVNRLKIGQEVGAGLRFGMIKYSSRVDIFLPLDVKIRVKVRDKVFAGTTILGDFSSD